jgi:hypothetical protein
MPFQSVPIHSSAHVRRAVFRLRVESGVTTGNYTRIKHDFVKTCHFEPRISRTAFFPACLRFPRIPGRCMPETRVIAQKSFWCQKIMSSRKVPSRGVKSDVHPIYVLVVRSGALQTAAPSRTPVNLPAAQFLVSNLLIDRNSAVGTVTSYKLDDRGILVRLLARARNFHLLPNVQTRYGTYPASYSVGGGRYFPGNKAALVWC